MFEGYIKLTLLSDTCFSRGDGIAGVIDTTVVCDEYGLPEIPAKTLKGIFREAAKDVVHAFPESIREIWFSSDPIFSFFGKAGEKAPSPLFLDSGRLHEYQMIRAWIESLQKEEKANIQILKPNSAKVLCAFTTDRNQTTRDPHAYGAPLENTLRRTRYILKNKTFHFPLQIFQEGEALQRSLRMLALTAAAATRGGLNRTRGPGEIRCTLHGGQDKKNLTHDLLVKIHQKEANNSVWNSPPVFTFPLESSQEAKQSEGGESASRDDAPIKISGGEEATSSVNDSQKCEVQFELTLHEPALLPQENNDPNESRTMSYIPGSAILAAFAHRYIQLTGKDNKQVIEDEPFQQMFIQGELRFLPAYPSYRNPQNMEESIRVLPTSVSIQYDTDNDKFFDAMNESERENPKKNPHHFCEITDNGIHLAQSPQLAMSYHHQRSKYRSKGRAQEGDGAIFTYTALQAQQTFQGRILGKRKALNKFLQQMNWNPEQSLKIRLGRSRSTQYGGKAELKIINIDYPIQNFESEVNSDLEELEENEKVQVLFTSPLLFRNPETGEPGVFIPTLEKELSRVLCGDTRKLTIVDYYTRRTRIGGFSSVTGFPLPLFPALDAGSTFLLEAKEAVSIHPDAIWKSLGERTAEGFGRIALRDASNEISIDEARPDSSSYMVKPDSNLEPAKFYQNDEINFLLKHLVYNYLDEEVQSKAISMANDISESIGSVNASLLGRLELICLNTEIEPKKRINQLAKPARDKAINNEVFNSPHYEHLEFISKDGFDWDCETLSGLKNSLPGDFGGWSDLINKNFHEWNSKFRQIFYATYFSILRMKLVKNKNSNQNYPEGELYDE